MEDYLSDFRPETVIKYKQNRKQYQNKSVNMKEYYLKYSKNKNNKKYYFVDPLGKYFFEHLNTETFKDIDLSFEVMKEKPFSATYDNLNKIYTFYIENMKNSQDQKESKEKREKIEKFIRSASDINFPQKECLECICKFQNFKSEEYTYNYFPIICHILVDYFDDLKKPIIIMEKIISERKPSDVFHNYCISYIWEILKISLKDKVEYLINNQTQLFEVLLFFNKEKLKDEILIVPDELKTVIEKETKIFRKPSKIYIRRKNIPKPKVLNMILYILTFNNSESFFTTLKRSEPSSLSITLAIAQISLNILNFLNDSQYDDLEIDEKTHLENIQGAFENLTQISSQPNFISNNNMHTISFLIHVLIDFYCKYKKKFSLELTNKPLFCTFLIFGPPFFSFPDARENRKLMLDEFRNSKFLDEFQKNANFPPDNIMKYYFDFYSSSPSLYNNSGNSQNEPGNGQNKPENKSGNIQDELEEITPHAFFYYLIYAIEGSQNNEELLNSINSKTLKKIEQDTYENLFDLRKLKKIEQQNEKSTSDDFEQQRIVNFDDLNDPLIYFDIVLPYYLFKEAKVGVSPNENHGIFHCKLREIIRTTGKKFWSLYIDVKPSDFAELTIQPAVVDKDTRKIFSKVRRLLFWYLLQFIIIVDKDTSKAEMYCDEIKCKRSFIKYFIQSNNPKDRDLNFLRLIQNPDNKPLLKGIETEAREFCRQKLLMYSEISLIDSKDTMEKLDTIIKYFTECLNKSDFSDCNQKATANNVLQLAIKQLKFNSAGNAPGSTLLNQMCKKMFKTFTDSLENSKNKEVDDFFLQLFIAYAYESISLIPTTSVLKKITKILSKLNSQQSKTVIVALFNFFERKHLQHDLILKILKNEQISLMKKNVINNNSGTLFKPSDNFCFDCKKKITDSNEISLLQFFPCGHVFHIFDCTGNRNSIYYKKCPVCSNQKEKTSSKKNPKNEINNPSFEKYFLKRDLRLHNDIELIPSLVESMKFPTCISAPKPPVEVKYDEVNSLFDSNENLNVFRP